MREDLYRVWIPGETVCENVRIEYAFMIAQSVMEKFYAEPGMQVTVERMNNDKEETKHGT